MGYNIGKVLIKKKYVAGEFDAMIKELVVKIEHLYLNRNLLDQMRLNCHNHFNDNFSLDKRNEKLNKIYNKILKEIFVCIYVNFFLIFQKIKTLKIYQVCFFINSSTVS